MTGPDDRDGGEAAAATGGGEAAATGAGTGTGAGAADATGDDRYAVTMDDDAVDAFLGTGGTGVLALARDDESYAIPVSYGYDATDRAAYVRLAFTPDEDDLKRRFVSRGGTATLVVQADGDEGWRSVLVRGSLREVTESALDGDVAAAVHRMSIPFVGIYDRPARELDFRLYRLDPDSITGRREPSDGAP